MVLMKISVSAKPHSPTLIDLYLGGILGWFKGILLWILRFYHMTRTLESFFLPSKGKSRGTRWAIPSQIETERSVYIQYTDHVYEEEVYDLEPLRYPFKVQLMEDLPKRMVEQLRKSIAGKYVGRDLYGAWSYWQDFNKMDLSESKRAVSYVAWDTWNFLSIAFKMIHPNDRLKIRTSAYSRDERVDCDICLKFLSSDETAVLGEALDASSAETYISDLVKLASGELPSNFEGELPDKFVGHEAILAKVCHLLLSGPAVKLIGQLSSYPT
jgi:hypothetical protein